MKQTKTGGRQERLRAILIHFQPIHSRDSVASTVYRGMVRGLLETPPGQKRDKNHDAYNTERAWLRNLAFVAGLYTLIPTDETVLKAEAEKLLLKMFGKGFSADRLARFNTAERSRTGKNGDAAWRLVKKLRKHYCLPN